MSSRRIPSPACSAALVLVTACLMLQPAVVTAGVGLADSGITTVDTAAPAVQVDNISPDAVYLGGDTVVFHWQTADDHPGGQSADYLARVLDDGQVLSSLAYFPETAAATWNWTAPEITSGNVYLEVMAADAYGNLTTVATNRFTVLRSVTPVPVPARGFSMAAPAPNPFNPSTRLAFHLPESGRIALKIFDARGRRVRTLLEGPQPAGDFETRWNGVDDRGRRQPGGLYIFVLDYFAGGKHQIQTRKAVLVP